MRTLFLMPDTWDLSLDVSGNIAFSTSTYQQAQDIASACRLFVKDQYFSQSSGIPYLTEVLGSYKYPLSLYKRYLEDAAMSVNGVISATANLSLSGDRVVGGYIEFTNDKGNTEKVNLWAI